MTTPQPPQPAAGYWSPHTAPRLGTSPGMRVNYMAWTGLLVSISGFVIPLGINGLVGVIFSILGLREARRLAQTGQESTGRQLAVAGIIVGISHTVVTIALVVGSIFAFYWFIDWMNTLTTQLQNSTLS